MNLSIESQIVRILVAIVAGSIIGYERMKKHKEPGVRTHALITVVCTMITIVSAYGFSEFPGPRDPARLVANILTGIGFLAGGVIFITNRKDNNSEQTVVGLTTAAGIFGAATLGIPIGLGHYPLVVTTLIAIELSLQLEKILKKIGIIREDRRREQLSKVSGESKNEQENE